MNNAILLFVENDSDFASMTDAIEVVINAVRAAGVSHGGFELLATTRDNCPGALMAANNFRAAMRDSGAKRVDMSEDDVVRELPDFMPEL